VASTHLAGLGAREVSRSQFVALLRQYASRASAGKWVGGPQQRA
jgi:Leu/Phe-tRNA-protein transferase